ncbi:MAG: ribonuclease Y [Candidatus Harrisonbacteria bacterium]|nr:ribonuclease Y [Candidatus Harrisonbacteria bacterium]
MNLFNPVVLGFLALGLAVGYFVRNVIATRRARRIEETIRKRISDAKAEAQDIVSKAQAQSITVLDEIKKDEKERKEKLDKTEERLLQREETLEKQLGVLSEREERINGEREKLGQEREEVKEKKEKAIAELEKLAGLSKEAAKEKLMSETKEVYQTDLVETIQKMEHDRKDEIEKKASEIITGALMRYARSHVSDVTTTVFTLPSEDLKGKIIGREGRNIKALERATGVEIVVDETPETVILSSFDPLRREIARLSLERLIKDGRIQPARIEETVEEVKQDMIRRMQEIGEQATMEVGVLGFPKEILQLIGRLHFRTSYGQNVLTHSIEMAHLSGMMARELGANVDVAKKGALVHDIGKAISHEVEGTHVDLGMKILSKYGVDEAVINAMRSHHEDYPFATSEAFIVTAADILSAGRPGARRDTVEQYLKRLRDLEAIASNFKSVKQAYALSAGREIRIFVVPEQIDDFGALQLAKDVAFKVQQDMKYPGEIKVNVIRETRAVEYAR